MDERSFKTRSASIIAVGGSEWDTLALPLMQLTLVSTHMDIVDKMLVIHILCVHNCVDMWITSIYM